jgi:hypothetical protein
VLAREGAATATHPFQHTLTRSRSTHCQGRTHSLLTVKRAACTVKAGGGRTHRCLERHALAGGLSGECLKAQPALLCEAAKQQACAKVKGVGATLRCVEQHKAELEKACPKSEHAQQLDRQRAQEAERRRQRQK